MMCFVVIKARDRSWLCLLFTTPHQRGLGAPTPLKQLNNLSIKFGRIIAPPHPYMRNLPIVLGMDAGIDIYEKYEAVL